MMSSCDVSLQLQHDGRLNTNPDISSDLTSLDGSGKHAFRQAQYRQLICLQRIMAQLL